MESLVQLAETLGVSKIASVAAKNCSHRLSERAKGDRGRKTRDFNRQPHLLVREPDSVTALISFCIEMTKDDKNLLKLLEKYAQPKQKHLPGG